MSNYHVRIQQIKTLNKSIPIKMYDVHPSAFLIPADTSQETVYLLTKWRKKYGDYFATKFEPTEKRTRKWLKEQVIENKDKILFLIILNKQKVGHIGLFNYSENDNSAEIDNVLRGERKEYPGLMEKVMKSILNVGFKDLKLSKITLKVFSDNHKAIDLYKRGGMIEIERIPLKKIITQDGWKWEESHLPKNENPQKFFSLMEITKAKNKKSKLKKNGES